MDWSNIMFGSQAAIASLVGIGITLGIMGFFVYYFISHINSALPEGSENDSK